MSRVHFDSRHNQVVSEIRGGTNAVLAGQSSSTNTVVSEMRAMEERLKLCLPTGETNMQTVEDGPMETADEETHQMPTGETNMLCIEDVPMETADEETHQTETIDEAGYIAQSEDVSMESAEAPEKNEEPRESEGECMDSAKSLEKDGEPRESEPHESEVESMESAKSLEKDEEPCHILTDETIGQVGEIMEETRVSMESIDINLDELEAVRRFKARTFWAAFEIMEHHRLHKQFKKMWDKEKQVDEMLI